MQDKSNNKEKVMKRLSHLRQIEIERQKIWKENKVFEADAEENWKDKYNLEQKNSKKFLITFPYPYMNGRLHLGHGFSLSKCEFQSRYQRLIGKNVLFPFGFHCTGMPIAAASKRVQNEFKENPDIIKQIKEHKLKKTKKEMTQVEILKEVGVADEDLQKFENPDFWLQYFPPYAQSDLEKLGANIDFRRSFITTDKQKYYDKFIEWHMLKLKEHNFIDFGKRNAIFSIREDQPCADHDRSCGEGLGPQEYTLIKMELLQSEKIPEKIKNIISANKKIFLVAATLRPETMYGQTNCYILPKGEYGLYEMANGEIYISSEHAMINMAYQEKTKEPKKAIPLLKIKGEELIGAKISAPLSIYKEVYLFPMETISISPIPNPHYYNIIENFIYI